MKIGPRLAPFGSEPACEKRRSLDFWCPTEPPSRRLGAKYLQTSRFWGHHKGREKGTKWRDQRSYAASSTGELVPRIRRACRRR
jgi:hypothetical protein